MPLGQHKRREIFSQPELWSEALHVFERGSVAIEKHFAGDSPDQVIVTGCGTTYYLALTAARLLRKAGVDARAFPASELVLHADNVFLPKRKYLLLAVSRSGSTTETVRACRDFKSNVCGSVITVTCDSDSPLALASDACIAIDAAQERSVAQTRSFTSMAVVLQGLAAALAGHEASGDARLPNICRDLLADNDALAKSLAERSRLQRFFFLGSGALYGIACEAMLKMKEMSLSYSEAYHTLEFRHGPMSMVDERSLVIGLIAPESAAHELQVLREMQAQGATILVIGQSAVEFPYQVALPADLCAWNMPVLYLPVLQLLAFYRALHMGHDPDQPQHLSAVISLDNL